MEEVVMPEPRTMEEIQKDYGTLCAQLGELTFKAALIESQQNQLKEKINQVNMEATQLKQSEAPNA